MENNIIAIYALVKDKQLEELKKEFTSYEIKQKHELAEDDYSRIEIVYGWDNELSDRYTKGQLSALKWVQKETAGLDSLPLSLKENPRIIVSNVSGIHAVPIAENVFGYILGVARGLFQSKDYMNDKQWKKLELTGDLFSLKDKKILVMGTGSVGSQIGKVAKFYGMKTIGVNSNGREADYFDETLSIDNMTDVLKSIDFVVNTLPGTSSTRGIFDMDFFSKMNENSYYINVGRGDSVVESDLLIALKDQTIKAAYIDVATVEPLSMDSKLWELDNLLITPHTSGIVEHFREAIYPIFKENLVAYIDKGSIKKNEYNREKGY